MKSPFNKLGFVFVLFLFSCNSSKKPLSDREKEGLKGDVIAIYTNNGSNVWLTETFKEFNPNGDLIKEIIYHNINSEDQYTEKIYNYSNKRIETIDIIDLRINKIFKGQTKFSYDENGLLVKTEENISDKQTTCTYKYKDGKKVEEKIEKTYTWDDNTINSDLTTKQFFYNSKNLIDSTTEIWINGNEFTQLIISKFDNNERVIKETYYRSKDGLPSPIEENLSAVSVIDYDQYGNELKIVSTGKGQWSNSKKEFLYKYDDNGNWIERGMIYNGKMETENYTKKIFYKDQEYQSVSSKFESIKLTHLNSSSNVSTSKSIQTTVNSENSNNNYQQQQSQPNQKVWVNCRDCNGKGIKICTYCTGRGSVSCTSCYGRGWNYNTPSDPKHTCLSCGGQGVRKCEHCYGKGNNGTCSHCGGRGQVLE
jgi:hypothetical protein